MVTEEVNVDGKEQEPALILGEGAGTLVETAHIWHGKGRASCSGWIAASVRLLLKVHFFRSLGPK